MLAIFATLKTLGFSLEQRLRREETGATAVEYAMLVGLIAVAVIAVLIILGPQIAGIFTNVSNSLKPAAG